jgi:microcin C transport system substrate-binding protein
MQRIENIKFYILSALVLLLVACGGESDQGAEVESSLDNTQEILDFYDANPELITFATIDDLPNDLIWEEGMDQPEIGSPDAVKGGTYYEVLDDFPPTLRTIGPDSNFSSRSWIRDNYDMGYAPPEYQ